MPGFFNLIDMTNLIRTIIILTLSACISISANAQIKKHSVADAHSHNDYKNNIPFYRAYEKGFGSIEADVYAANGRLMVAHDKKGITANVH